MWNRRCGNSDDKKEKEENKDNHCPRKPTCLGLTELSREHGLQKCHDGDRNREPSYDQ
jgi:hypothetical protein